MNILIAGTSGSIGKGLCEELSNRGHSLFTISRSGQVVHGRSKSHLKSDCSNPDSVEAIREWINEQSIQPDLVIQCAGLLHKTEQMPEKALSKINESWLQKSISANLTSHIHLAQAIDKLVARNRPIQWVSLSALVGSISDNELGGWYSYRMSKAALNMFIRNLSIEWGRRAPGSIVSAMHPGTTVSELSRPFQKNIKPEKLYSVELTTERIADVVEALNPDQHGRLLHWDGSVVPF